MYLRKKVKVKHNFLMFFYYLSTIDFVMDSVLIEQLDVKKKENLLNLPNEIILKILGFCNTQDLHLNVALVSFYCVKLTLLQNQTQN
jgi:hypothetical protein